MITILLIIVTINKITNNNYNMNMMYLIGIFFTIFYYFNTNTMNSTTELPLQASHKNTKSILYKHNKTYTRSKSREKKSRHVVFTPYNYRLHFDKNVPLIGKQQLFCDEILMKSCT
jgi:hypothetical protein